MVKNILLLSPFFAEVQEYIKNIQNDSQKNSKFANNLLVQIKQQLHKMEQLKLSLEIKERKHDKFSGKPLPPPLNGEMRLPSQECTFSGLPARDVTSKGNKSGELMMRRKVFKFWQYTDKVFGVIISHWLLLYHSQRDSKTFCTINLINYEAREANDFVALDSQAFQLHPIDPDARKTVYNFMATTAKDMQQWMANINDVKRESGVIKSSKSDYSPREERSFNISLQPPDAEYEVMCPENTTFNTSNNRESIESNESFSDVENGVSGIYDTISPSDIKFKPVKEENLPGPIVPPKNFTTSNNEYERVITNNEVASFPSAISYKDLPPEVDTSGSSEKIYEEVAPLPSHETIVLSSTFNSVFSSHNHSSNRFNTDFFSSLETSRSNKPKLGVESDYEDIKTCSRTARSLEDSSVTWELETKFQTFRASSIERKNNQKPKNAPPLPAKPFR